MATKTTNKRSKKKLFSVIGGVVLLVAIAVASVAARRGDKSIPITTDRAFRKTITQLVTATGKIQPEVEVKIAPEVSGEIIEIPVVEGQIVHKGDLLLKIKPDVYQAQVEAQRAALNGARASVLQNKAELDKADVDYKRAQQLFRQGLLSDSDRKAAETTYASAKAGLETSQFDVQRAEGALKQISDSLAKTVIFSPVDGTISSLTSRVGERVVGTIQFAGTEVMRIANLNNMEAQVDVNENDIVNVKVGDDVNISVDAYPDRVLHGVVREIASTATTQNAGSQQEVTNFQVKISIPTPPVPLRPGMSATADIETATVKDAVVVPIQSVTVRESGSKLSPEELEKQTAEQKAQQGDNRADVTNEAADKRKERETRQKLVRVVFIRNGDTVRQQKVETG
ncbi:MAG TPA: efflux RND transporter periplasmic adaptor subunit, partial [Thermoanaerobaculia bacterium]|nr:efflux RND transporter periplasmic adaptor subunit [Thermoanaerobaculia bacterium]